MATKEKEQKKATAGAETGLPARYPGVWNRRASIRVDVLHWIANDVNLDVLACARDRHWCNKLWIAIKFAMANLGDVRTGR